MTVVNNSWGHEAQTVEAMAIPAIVSVQYDISG